MNMKEAARLKPGAIVREAWDVFAAGRGHGLVLSKKYIEEEHEAKILCRKKYERYDLVVHWFNGPRAYGRLHGVAIGTSNPEVVENWEVMLVSHAD